MEASRLYALDAIGICLNKRILMYNTLAPNININSYGLVNALDTLVCCCLSVDVLLKRTVCQYVSPVKQLTHA